MKTCSKCRSTTDAFYADRRASDGLQSQCKPCVRADQKAHYENHRVEYSDRHKALYEQSNDAVKQRMKTHYAANRDSVKARVAAYQASRKEEISLKRRSSRLQRKGFLL
jgi:hypothetical protein